MIPVVRDPMEHYWMHCWAILVHSPSINISLRSLHTFSPISVTSCLYPWSFPSEILYALLVTSYCHMYLIHSTWQSRWISQMGKIYSDNTECLTIKTMEKLHWLFENLCYISDLRRKQAFKFPFHIHVNWGLYCTNTDEDNSPEKICCSFGNDTYWWRVKPCLPWCIHFDHFVQGTFIACAGV